MATLPLSLNPAGFVPLVDHRAEWPMASQQENGRLRIVLRTGRDQVAAAGVVWADRYEQGGGPDRAGLGRPPWLERACEHSGRDAQWDYWEAELELPTGRFAYWLWVLPGGAQSGLPAGGQVPASASRAGVWWVGDSGLARARHVVWPFEWPHQLAGESPAVPDWARGAFFYQIFVDRFFNGDPANDPPGTLPWPQDTSQPVPKGAGLFYGGDLAGVIQKLPYLAGLGVDAIYLTPIFRSPSNHKYDTEDYLDVDPAFGTQDLLADLTAQAHRHGIRVILDLVFNHSGDRFFAFRNLLEQGAASPYREWYFPGNLPVSQAPPNYETFANAVVTMPKLNTANPEVRRYLVGVVRRWLQIADVDGFRLDVANEVARELWREVLESARRVKPDVFIVGEIWHRAASWLRGDMFHSVMNYPWRAPVLDFFARGSIGPTELWERLESIRFTYAPPVTEALVNLLGSHDTPRFLRLAGGELWRLEMATLFQFAYPGVAQVYYGDEVAMDGGGDPDCRRPMNWSPGRDGQSMLQLVRDLGQWRRRYPALRTGGVELAAVDDVAEAFAFWRVPRLPGVARDQRGAGADSGTRTGGSERCLVVVNRGMRPWQAPVPEITGAGLRVTERLATGELEVSDRAAVVGPRSAAILAIGR
ncbi:MAG: alpha amylase N-terminal ig-like domain-containing protein [Bacillota bacterium]